MNESKNKRKITVHRENYSSLVGNISTLLESARRNSAHAVNTILTATYWEIGRRIVEYEYKGMDRTAYYGEKLLENLSLDLIKKFGRGFSQPNLTIIKLFYQNYPEDKIRQTLSNKSFVTEKSDTASRIMQKNIGQIIIKTRQWV
jgi:hypothetical protein